MRAHSSHKEGSSSELVMASSCCDIVAAESPWQTASKLICLAGRPRVLRMIDVADEEQVDRESASLPFLPPPPSGINASNLYVMSTKDEKEKSKWWKTMEPNQNKTKREKEELSLELSLKITVALRSFAYCSLQVYYVIWIESTSYIRASYTWEQSKCF